MSATLGTERIGYKTFDRWLAKNYPRLRVLHLPATVLFSVATSAIAASYAHLTSMTEGRLNSTTGSTAIWFLICCLAATYWIVLQWQERTDLPAGCKATFAWSLLPNILCLGLIFLPVIVNSEQNAATIRESMPLQPILQAYEELDNRFPPQSRYTGDRRRHRGPYMVRYDAVSLEQTECVGTIRQCLDEGFKAEGSFGPDAAWCAVDTDYLARTTIDKVYGEKLMSDLCSGLPPAPFDIEFDSWIELKSAKLRKLLEGEMALNMSVVFDAHDASSTEQYRYRAGMFSGYVGLLSLIVFIWIFASLTSLFSIIRPRTLVIACGILVGLLAFVLTFQRTFKIGHDSLTTWMRISCVAIPLAALVVLRFMRTRTWRTDLVCITATTSAPFLVTVWWRLAPLAFHATEIYAERSGFRVTAAQGGAAAALLISLVLSPLSTAVLDRYRNLPEA